MHCIRAGHRRPCQCVIYHKILLTQLDRCGGPPLAYLAISAAVVAGSEIGASFELVNAGDAEMDIATLHVNKAVG